jgi:hypothetical protein
MDLTIKQTKALDYLEDKVTNEVLFGGGAGGAKSVLGCYWQLKNRLKYPGTRSIIGRSKLKTLKETTLQSFFWVCKTQGLKSDKHYYYNQTSGIIKLYNGSEILLKDLCEYPSDPNFDELGSLEITDAFVDEANQIGDKARNIIQSRIRYMLDENNLIPKILYTCNPSKNWTYREFYRPDKEGTIQPHRKFVQALYHDNPFISRHYIDNLKKMDKVSRERLEFGNWEYDDDPGVLISYDNILNIFTNDFPALSGPKYITADIARKGKDSTTIGLWNGFRCERIITLQKSLVTETAKEINKIRLDNQIPISHVICDEDGVGGGVVDILECVGFINNSRAIGGKNYANLKTQCYFALADRCNSNGLYVYTNDDKEKEGIIQELEQVKQDKIDQDGKIYIITKEQVKEKIGRSPDRSDMLMMREWFELSNESYIY